VGNLYFLSNTHTAFKMVGDYRVWTASSTTEYSGWNYKEKWNERTTYFME